MKERLKKLRKSLNLTQQEFGERIGVKANTISTYEIGRNDPIDAVVNLICREFNVNEIWLRTGKGEMFSPEPVDELDAIVQAHGLTKGDRILIERFIALKPEAREAVLRFAIDIASRFNADTPCTPMPRAKEAVRPTTAEREDNPEDPDIEAEVAAFRQDLILEKEAAARSQASTVSDASGEKLA